jgi:DNA invertase Pin-like site-specific DNA recombinase
MSPHTGNFVAYYRVSTDKQGASGLGLEAQQAAVQAYLNGGTWKLVAEFTEIESGKRSDRPKLAEALVACKRRRATLVIAKLDRLARKVHFISGLMESGVDFVCADCPNDDRFMLHIRAAIAEDEARKISQRTKAALQAAKTRGIRLGGYRGGPPPDKTACEASLDIRRAKASEFAAEISATVAEIEACGITSANAVATELNRRGYRAPRGGEWRAQQVLRLRNGA